MTELATIVADLAGGMKAADARHPVARSSRGGRTYSPGIGPHSESDTVRLALNELPEYAGCVQREVPYPAAPRSRCDLCIGSDPTWEWCIEIKMLRMLGDNGKPNDNILMHILSPYPAHRSALTDCEKLLASGLSGRKAIMIYAYDYADWPAVDAIEAFELLASRRIRLSPRRFAQADGLVHPVHRCVHVYGWELLG